MTLQTVDSRLLHTVPNPNTVDRTKPCLLTCHECLSRHTRRHCTEWLYPYHQAIEKPVQRLQEKRQNPHTFDACVCRTPTVSPNQKTDPTPFVPPVNTAQPSIPKDGDQMPNTLQVFLDNPKQEDQSCKGCENTRLWNSAPLYKPNRLHTSSSNTNPWKACHRPIQERSNSRQVPTTEVVGLQLGDLTVACHSRLLD